MDKTLPACVTRGIDLLDQVRPRWRAKINPRTLNMNHCRKCILGQVFGDFWTALTTLNNKSPDFGKVTSHIYGFNSNTYGPNSFTYTELLKEWKQRLKTPKKPTRNQ